MHVVAAPATFDIPRQDAGAALTQFARQSGIPVLFPVRPRPGSHRECGARSLRAAGGAAAVAAEHRARGAGRCARADQCPRRAGSSFARATRGSPRMPSPSTAPEVTVTGSRIERDGRVTPTPVTAIGSGELQSMGPGGLIDALVQLPQFLNNDTPQTQAFQTGGAAGASFLNLRGIGSARTLMLLDGRRIVPTHAQRRGRRRAAAEGAAPARRSRDRGRIGGLWLGRGRRCRQLPARHELERTGTARPGRRLAAGRRGQRRVGDDLGAGRSGRSRIWRWRQSGRRTDGIRGYADRNWFESWAVVAEHRSGRAGGAHGARRAGDGLHLRRAHHGRPACAARSSWRAACPRRSCAARTSLRPPRPAAAASIRGATWSGSSRTSGGRAGSRNSRPAGTGARRHSVSCCSATATTISRRTRRASGVVWSATIEADNAFLPAATRTAMQAAGIERFPLARMSPDLGAPGADNRSVLASATVGFEAPLGPRLRARGLLPVRTQSRRAAVRGRGAGGSHLSRARRGHRSAQRRDRVPVHADVPRRWLRACEPVRSRLDRGRPRARGSPKAAASRTSVSRSTSGSSRHRGPIANLPAGTATLAVGTAWRHEAVSNRPTRWPDRLNGLTVRAAAARRIPRPAGRVRRFAEHLRTHRRFDRHGQLCGVGTLRRGRRAAGRVTRRLVGASI